MSRSVVCALIALAAVSSTVLWAQEIYKTYDEDGNVVYTDQRPSDDALPMDLAPITVVEGFEPNKPEVSPPDQQPTNTPSTSGTTSGSADVVAYDEFVILTPSPDENFWGTGGTLNARTQSGQTLRRGDTVRYYIDGELRLEVAAFSASLTDIVRGEHQLKVEIVNSQGQIMASAGPVSFHMKQQSVLGTNNPNAAGDSSPLSFSNAADGG